MARSTAGAVANSIVRFSAEYGDLITNLKLQKLLYYAQAWHLALHNEPLFDDHFEAWVHGPAQPSVYRAFKNFASKPIVIPEDAPFENAKEAWLHIADVLQAYSGYSAYQLELMTHREQPWLEARGDLPPDAPCNEKINTNTMREFYRKRLKGPVGT